MVDVDIEASELMLKVVEVAGDQERSCEVDAPSAVVEGWRLVG
jgi:hypothetical protein